MYNGEMIIDLFAGGGGASTGIEMALGVSPDVAVNHDPQAIALHEANHPDTKHFIEDVFEVDPIKVTDGKPVGLLWMSPDCKHFSKAKGSRPVSCDVRSLAWVGISWATQVRPRVLFLENVEEFRDWGPIDDDGKPIKAKKGETFDEFVLALENLGYNVEWNEMRASDYGAPTIRKRLFLIARCDGEPITWPEPTHGDPEKFPDRIAWKTAADCIDWDIPTYSIFLSKEEGKKYNVRRPLAENTMTRIAKGMEKFVLKNKNPYIVKNAVPFVSTFYGGAIGATARGNKIDAPVGTITAGGSRHSLVMAFVAQHNLGVVGRKVDSPLSTITQTGSQQQLVKAYVMKYYGQGEGSAVSEPAHTITTKERFALVQVAEEEYEVTDVAMRMFTPRELYRAQGFPESYKINIMYNGKQLPKTAQVRMCGNSVVPKLAQVLIEANVKVEEMTNKRSA